MSSSCAMDDQELLASRRLSSLNLNVREEEIPLKHYWCRVAYQQHDKANLKTHRHSFFELHLCLEGQCEIAVDDTSFCVTPKTFLLLPPQKKHTILSQSEFFSKFVWGFSVRDPDVAKKLSECCQNGRLCAVEEPFLRGLRVILDNSLGDDFEYHSVIRGQLYYLFVLLVRQMTNLHAKNRFQKNTSMQLAEIRKYLLDNLSVNLSATDIAEQFYLSRKQLTRICMEECDMTVNQLKHSLQLERIRQMLAETDASLEEIAQAVGFSDKYSMSKFFHKHEGMPPVKYRKSIHS